MLTDVERAEPSIARFCRMYRGPRDKVMVCPERPEAKVIVSPGLALAMASRREQSASQTPSSVSAVLVTVRVAARTVCTGAAAHSPHSKARTRAKRSRLKSGCRIGFSAGMAPPRRQGGIKGVGWHAPGGINSFCALDPKNFPRWLQM